MEEIKYNYSIEDNLNATKVLFKQRNKRKTNLVTLLVLFVTMIGLLVSLNALIKKQANWYVGILSILLLVGYFSSDFIVTKFQLKKQKEFFYSGILKDVTKIEICFDDKKLTEKFLNKEKTVGVNNYNFKELTYLGLKKDGYYLIFKEENIVLLKPQVMTAKQKSLIFNLKNYLNPPKKQKKIKK